MIPPKRLALVGALALVYALCYVAIKTGLAFAPPLAFGGLRAAVASASLFLGLAIARQPLLPPRNLWPWILALAISGTAVAYTGMFMSPGRTGAGIASVIGNTGPLMIVGLATLVLGERLTRAKTLAIMLGFAGVSLISYSNVSGPEASRSIGGALALMAAAGLAAESVIFKLMDAGKALLRIVAWQFLLGSVPLLALSMWFERDAGIMWNPAFVAILLFLAVIGSAAAVSVWYWLIQREEIGRLSLLLFLVPVLGLGFAVTMFGEHVGLLEMIGVALTLSGLAFVVLEQRRDLPPRAA